MTLSVRTIEGRDELRWRELFDGYTRFYERQPNESITRHAWQRIMDPGCPMYAIVAEDKADQVVGIANYVIHENTSMPTPACYLQDLFVDIDRRGHGAGRLMLNWLIAEMGKQGWSRLYWHTKENNHQARRLYDQYTPHSGFVRYVIANPAVPK